MAAGQGFKTFTTGEVLTAADTNGYLMQGVLVFADAAARTSAITSPQEGQTSYLKNTDEIQVYSGSAWVTKSGSLPSQTGNSGKYLTTDGTNTSWGTIAAGGLTLLSTTNLSGISTTISSIDQTYTNLLIVVQNAYVNSATQFRINLNGSGSSVAMSQVSGGTAGTNPNLATVSNLPTASGSESHSCLVSNYSNSTYTKPVIFYGSIGTSASNTVFMGGISVDTTAITSFDVATLNGTSTFSGGRVLVYGVK